jgi:membrane-associated phospholipid phosphatase
MKKLIISVFTLLGMNSIIFAKSTTESLGDVFSIIIPITAYTTSIYLDDKEGQVEFYKSFGSTMAATYILKYTVREKRPDSDNRDSFPSGHTSSAFAGAAFIQQRYGWKYSILPYCMAIYTGYSRVHSNRHHPVDVYASAALGILVNWYFVTPYKNLQIIPLVDSDFQGVRISYRW